MIYLNKRLKRKQGLLLILCLIFSSTAFSQEPRGNASPYASNVFLEICGNGSILSINYDRRFSEGNHGFGWRGGVGLGFIPGHMLGDFVLTVPAGINYLTGKGSSHLEAGAGVTFGSERFNPAGGRSPRASVFFVPSLGYRLQPDNKRFTFRIVASPFIASKTVFWGGVSFGKRF